MPVCPQCRSEYRAGFETCADCGLPLVEASQLPAPRAVGESVQEVVIASYNGQPEAEMCAELLRGEGIPSVVVQLLPGPRLAWGMVPCELRVRATDVEQARAVLGLD